MSDLPIGVSRFSGRRPWVLINRRSRIGGCRNPTTAETLTSGGFIIRVSFELADPPGVSQWFAHCPGQEENHFNGDPLILCSAEAFVLLVISFTGNSSRKPSADYFVYRAGSGTPQLDLIPMPYPRNFDHKAVGILPLCDGVSGHYAVVVPVPRFTRSAQRIEYELRVFWSESKTWTAKKARLASDSETNYGKVLHHEGTEVISLGAGLLGWVDLWWGILVCNVLDKDPLMRLIQWPVPEPREYELFNMESDHISATPFRDVNVVNGFIRFVELKFHNHTVVNQGVIKKG